MKIILILLLCLCSFSAKAKVKVAFFEAYDYTGEVIRLLPKSEFFHVAIQIEGVWYHTDQEDGVTVLKPFKNFSYLGPEYKLKAILFNESIDISQSSIAPFLGLPFDFYYNWFDDTTVCCTELVAKLIDIEPSQSFFASQYWEPASGLKRGGLGISPDELYTELLKRGFQIERFDFKGSKNMCKAFL